MALQFSTALRNTWMDAIETAVGASGLLRIYSGSVPANVAASEGTVLAELTLNSDFAGASSSGTITLNAITSDSSANASGTATCFRILTSGGTAVLQGTVTATGGGGDLTLNTTTITNGGTVAITSATFTAPGA